MELLKKQISIAGVGMGTGETMTPEAREAIRNAQLLIGAKRMLGVASAENQTCIEEIDAEKIIQIISECGQERIAVLMSGDTGFYSGAGKLLALLKEENVRVYPGISSLSFFSAKTGISWQDVKIISMHGRRAGLTAYLLRHQKVFALTDGSLGEQLEKLVRAGLGGCEVIVGERLSYPDERILRGTAAQLCGSEFHPLSVLFARNTTAGRMPAFGLPDSAFLRGDVPMTKSEVRAVSMSRLAVRSHDLVYDIGAGTGSVSVEMALAAEFGRVFAIECKEEALTLIRANKERFELENLEAVAGKAPEALRELPAPDVAFLGGTGGNMEEIMELLVQKNPAVRVVINAITLENAARAMELMRRLCFTDVELLQMAVAKGKPAGDCHMMMGMNPVFIISGNGPSPETEGKIL